MRRVLALVACLAFAACRRDGLPAAVTLEEVVVQLAPPLIAGATVAAPAPDAVRAGFLQPGGKRPGEMPRECLVTPAPSSVRFPITVPDDGRLRFAVGVGGTVEPGTRTSGVRFRVLIDGAARFDRVLDPAARRSHREWVAGEVALDREAGRTVEVTLETQIVEPALPPAGDPGWHHIRLVRRTTRDRQRAAPGAPNLLVLLVDTLRADRLGTYGAEPSPSPTLDALARRGLVFEDSVSQSSWTMASVGSILTGLHPRSHGAPPVTGRQPGADPSWGFLAERLVTWPELAQQAGITTVGVSANPLISRGTNLAQGFETFTEFPWDGRRHGWYAATEVNQHFLDWLDRNRAWRFVAYLHYMEPHDPYAPPPAMRPPPPAGLDRRLVAGDVTPAANAINVRGGAPLPAEAIAYLRQLYDAEIRVWDDALASLLAELERRRVLESTIVVVTADHGEEFQEHGRLKHGTQLYEESLRVPLVLVGPGIAAGRRADTAQGIDVFPTVAGLLGVTPPDGLPGRDLLATTAGRDAVAETTRGILPGGGPTDLTALRTPHWKLIVTGATGAVELFDLARDPGERASRPADPEAAAMQTTLERWTATAAPAPRSDGADPAMRAKLRALGYVE